MVVNMDKDKLRLIYGNNVHQISRDCYIAKTNDKQCIIFKDKLYNIDYEDSVDILFNKVAVVTNIQHTMLNSRAGKFSYMVHHIIEETTVRKARFINLDNGDTVNSNCWINTYGKIVSVNNDTLTLSILDRNLKTINQIQLKRKGKVHRISVIRDSRTHLDIGIYLVSELNLLEFGTINICIRINKNTMKITEIKEDSRV